MITIETRLALRSALIPKDLTNISTRDRANVLNAIAALHRICKDIQKCERQTVLLPLLVSHLTEMWEAGLLSWFTILFDYYDPSDDSDLPSRWDAVCYVSCIFTFLLHADFKLVCSNPRAVQLAAGLWLVKEHDYDRSKYSIICGWWDPFLSFLLQTFKDQNSHYRNHIYDVEGITDRSIVILALDRLQTCTEIKNCSIHQYMRLLDVINNISNPLDTSSGISPTMVIHGMTSTVNFMVSKIGDSENENKNVQYIQGCLEFFKSIRVFLLRADSIDVVREAMRSNLIKAFSGIRPHLGWYMKNLTNSEIAQRSVDYAFITVSAILPRYMMYNSVLGSVSWYLDKHTVDVVSKDCNIFSTALQNGFTISFKPTPRLSFCDNPKHNIFSVPEMIRKCSACKSVWYCSKECQKEHWNDEHRSICRTLLKPKKKSEHPTLRIGDHYSACRFAIQYIEPNRTHIQEKIEELHPGKTLSELAMIFDFNNQCTFRPRIVVRDIAATSISRHLPNSTVIQCNISLDSHHGVIVTAAGYLEDINNARGLGASWITGKAYTSYYRKDGNI